MGLNKPLDTKSDTLVNMYCYKILGAECSESGIISNEKFNKKEEKDTDYTDLLEPSKEETKDEDVIENAKERGLTFTKEDFKENPGLKLRIIKMLDATKKEDIGDFSEEKKNRIQKALKQKKEEERKKKEEERKKKEMEKKKEDEKRKKKKITKKADLFIFHETTKPNSKQLNPGDTIRLNGPGNANEPFCIQRRMSDTNSINCQGGECGFDYAFIGKCNNNNNSISEPYCDNRDAAHFIEINKDGTENNDRTQTIRFLSSKGDSLSDEICLAYSGEKVVYGNCKLSRNEDKNIKHKWKIYRKEGDNNFKILTPDKRCLTRVKFFDENEEGDKDNNKNEEQLYKNDQFLGPLASLKIEKCSKEKDIHQKFQIKSMGDTDDCKSPNSLPKIPKDVVSSINNKGNGFLTNSNT